MTQIIIVTAAFHATDSNWTATSPDVAGLFLTADTWGALIERLPTAVQDRLSRSTDRKGGEFSIEVLLHTSLRMTVATPAKYHFGVSTGARRIERCGRPTSPRSPDVSIHNGA